MDIVFEMLHDFRRRPSMFISPYTYETFVVYLSTLSHTLFYTQQTNVSFSRCFHEWVSSKIFGYIGSVHYQYFILHDVCGGDPELALEKLWSYLDEYEEYLTKNSIDDLEMCYKDL